MQLPDGRTATYTYDPFGRRIKKQVGSEVTIFVYADEGLIGEYTQTGTVTKTYGWRPGGIWGTNPVFMQENGQYYFYHNDHLGTPQTMTDAAGDIVWEATYDAFGKANIDPDSTIVNNLRFPGQYFDQETGLHYNWHRYYDPGTGRYISADPIGLRGGLNLFAYVQGNPLTRIDSLGLCPNLSRDCLDALATAGTDKNALSRLSDYWGVIEVAAAAHGIDPGMLAAIAIRETGVRNIPQQGGGDGRGLFQIDIGQNPSVTEKKAYDVTYSANFAAKMLASNMSYLSKEFPELSRSQLLQATAASYNFGSGNISGNPNTIDKGTTGNNYGINILNLMKHCLSGKVGASFKSQASGSQSIVSMPKGWGYSPTGSYLMP